MKKNPNDLWIFYGILLLIGVILALPFMFA